MFHVYFAVEPPPLLPEEKNLRAPMPVIPRIGETLVFGLSDHTWPRYRVERVEYQVHHFRSDGHAPFSGGDDEGMHDDELMALDAENMAVEVSVVISRVDRNAATIP